MTKTPHIEPSSRVAWPGTASVRASLQQLVDSDRLHPCLLFEGPAGVGKRHTADWLARYANCTGEEAQPCGECWSCRQIPQGHHPDVITVGLDPARSAPIISVKQARELTKSLALRPFAARRRFILIEPADAMTIEAANALLKTFEEPPSDTGFILITDKPSRILPTVRSRSQRVRFGPMSTGDLQQWLEEKRIDQAAALSCIAEGSLGVALALAEGELEAEREARDAALDALAGSLSDGFAFTEKLTKGDRGTWRPRVDRVLRALESMARDALMVSAQSQSEQLMNADRRALVEAWSSRLGVSGAGAVGQAISQTREDLDRFVNARLALDNLFAQLRAQLDAA